VSYYLTTGANQVITQPTLISPIALENSDKSSIGYITVGTEAEGVYEGAVSIQPGPNSLNPVGNQVGLTIRATTLGVNVEVGDNAQTDNLLYIAGPSGVGQVYDEVYNQPVSLQPLTQVQIAPLLTPANPEEVLRGGQAAIAAAIATPGSQLNIFKVPRTGAYMIQTEITVGNNVPTNSVVIPSTLVGGVPIWSSISLGFQIQGTVTSVPYASFEVLGGDFYGDQAFAGNSIITKTFTSLAILTAGVNYAVTLNCAAGWDIGTAGQIKTELVAMC
jgi:hypothetical protein